MSFGTYGGTLSAESGSVFLLLLGTSPAHPGSHPPAYPEEPTADPDSPAESLKVFPSRVGVPRRPEPTMSLLLVIFAFLIYRHAHMCMRIPRVTSLC